MLTSRGRQICRIRSRARFAASPAQHLVPLYLVPILSDPDRLVFCIPYEVPRGHLDQAIAAHARGDWAAANAQLRTFTESLFDHIAETLTPQGNRVLPAGHQRRQFRNHNRLDLGEEWLEHLNQLTGLFSRQD